MHIKFLKRIFSAKTQDTHSHIPKKKKYS